MRKLFFFLLLVTNWAHAQYATFTPSIYKPIQRDNSILQRSLEQIERRQNEANEQFSRLQMMLAEYGAKLYNDEATLIWFDEYKSRIRGAFNTLSELGWDEARNYAIRMQGEIANDPELTARIRTASEYVAKRNVIEESNNMDWNQKNEWKNNNPYCFVPIKNADGKVIGGRLGTKIEFEEQKREAERIRLEEEENARRLEEMERTRMYNMAHPFDDFNYSGYETIVNYPYCKNCPEGMRVTMVALSPTETRVEIELMTFNYYQWCSIAWDTYIKASGSSNQQLIRAENMAISPSRIEFNNPGEKLKFALVFPPLSSKTKSFSIIEPGKDGFKFKNIKIK